MATIYAILKEIRDLIVLLHTSVEYSNYRYVYYVEL